MRVQIYKTQNDDEEIVAYHEAGHAVAAAISGGFVQQVSIEPEENDRSGVTQVQWRNQNVSGTEHAIREIRVALAGPVAEMIYVGDYDHLRIQAEHAVDWRIANESASSLSSSPERRLQILSREASELYHYFRRDNVWAAVAEVADQLLTHGTIENSTLEEIIQQWIR